MFTPADRARLKGVLIDAAFVDPRVESAALLGSSAQGAEDDWSERVLGVGLLVLAAKQWRGRPRAGGEAELPAWMGAVEHFTAPRSAALGLALAAVGTIGTGLPVLLYFTMGERSERLLDELKGWMAQNNATIMASSAC